MSSPAAFGFGTGKRSQEVRKDRDFKNIGPGSYKVTLADKKREPQFSMGARLSNLSPSFMKAPGAGTFNPNTTLTKTKGSEWRFGTETRPDMSPKAVISNPSPFAYNVPSKMVEGPKAAMHARTDHIDMNKKNNYPGAGTYELMNKTNANQANSPRFSMGKETRDRDAHKKE